MIFTIAYTKFSKGVLPTCTHNRDFLPCLRFIFEICWSLFNSFSSPCSQFFSMSTIVLSEYKQSAPVSHWSLYTKEGSNFHSQIEWSSSIFTKDSTNMLCHFRTWHTSFSCTSFSIENHHAVRGCLPQHYDMYCYFFCCCNGHVQANIVLPSFLWHLSTPLKVFTR